MEHEQFEPVLSPVGIVLTVLGIVVAAWYLGKKQATEAPVEPEKAVVEEGKLNDIPSPCLPPNHLSDLVVHNRQKEKETRES